MNIVSVSALSFLNAAPLCWQLHDGRAPSWLDVHFYSPAETAERLSAGLCDVALLSSVEYFRIPELTLLDGPAVISRGPVRSVVLAARKPWSQVRTVGLTPLSRTSVALLKVLFSWTRADKGREVEYTVYSSLADAARQYDGVLAIGDPALQFDWGGLTVHDLALQWRNETGLPFVFAVWAMRQGVTAAGLHEFLWHSMRAGVAAIPSLASSHAASLQLPEGLLRDYLSNNLYYEMGEREKEGLRKFGAACQDLGLVTGRSEWRIMEVPESWRR